MRADHLMADAQALAFKLLTPGDLLGRASFLEVFDHGLAQTVEAHQCPTSRASLERIALSPPTAGHPCMAPPGLEHPDNIKPQAAT